MSYWAQSLRLDWGWRLSRHRLPRRWPPAISASLRAKPRPSIRCIGRGGAGVTAGNSPAVAIGATLPWGPFTRLTTSGRRWAFPSVGFGSIIIFFAAGSRHERRHGGG